MFSPSRLGSVVATDELAAVPLTFNDNLHDRFDRAPADTRLM